MAIIDVIKFDGLKSRDWIIYKHPKNNFVAGSQLIVGEGQAAIFVKGGQVCDLFNAGTYTLDSRNLPILQSITNIPFGGKTPFTAEIFFLNTVSKLNILWGTSTPIQVIDPKYFIKLRIRAFGQLGLKLSDYTLFLRELIGVVSPNEIIKYEKIMEFFKGLLIQKIKTIIADIIINQKISALEITPKLEEISSLAKEKITPEFNKFGLSIVNFFITSINFPDDDFNQINEILKDKAQFEIMGDNRYVTKRSFDVYDKAASNETGIAGALTAGCIGLGVGASMLGANMNNPINPNAILNETKILCPNCNEENPTNAKFCIGCGETLEKPKKSCPSCNAVITGNAKFCPECGASFSEKTCDCGAKLPANAKFCIECGKKVD
jgi:membrane protease subunit (stomatin/prohibitin family)